MTRIPRRSRFICSPAVSRLFAKKKSFQSFGPAPLVPLPELSVSFLPLASRRRSRSRRMESLGMGVPAWRAGHTGTRPRRRVAQLFRARRTGAPSTEPLRARRTGSSQWLRLEPVRHPQRARALRARRTPGSVGGRSDSHSLQAYMEMEVEAPPQPQEDASARQRRGDILR